MKTFSNRICSKVLFLL